MGGGIVMLYGSRVFNQRFFMIFEKNLFTANTNISKKIQFHGIFLGIVILNAGFWTVGLLRIPKKCEGTAKGGAKEVFHLSTSFATSFASPFAFFGNAK